MLDKVHATSWATCVGPSTCNIIQELSREGGLVLHSSVDCLNSATSVSNHCIPHVALKSETVRSL
jgi:hypothetical protein